MTAETTTPTAPETMRMVHVYKTRDKYGRPNVVAESNCQTVAVMVTLPKARAATDGIRYLVRDASQLVGTDPEYFVKRADAVTYFDMIVSKKMAELRKGFPNSVVILSDSRR